MTSKQGKENGRGTDSHYTTPPDSPPAASERVMRESDADEDSDMSLGREYDGQEIDEGGSEEEFVVAPNGKAFTGKAKANPSMIEAGLQGAGARERPSTWTDLDLSIIVALVAPVGNWLTGTDHLKNLFLICLLILYLHQLIEVPWQLYRSSRPKYAAPDTLRPNGSTSSGSRLIHLARSELHTHELAYLGLSLVSPFLGAMFLRHVLSVLNGPNLPHPLSWFSTTLFVLALGIRPWSHLIKRLRKRTQDLHDTIHYHYPSPGLQNRIETDHKVKDLVTRVEQLEKEIERLRAIATETKDTLEDVYDDVSGSLEDVDRALRRQDRKAEVGRSSQEKRLAALEATLSHFVDEWKHSEAMRGSGHWDETMVKAYTQMHPVLDRLVSIALFVPEKFLSVLRPTYPPRLLINGASNHSGSPSTGPLSPGSSGKLHISRSPRLETIPEDSDDTTLSTGSIEVIPDAHGIADGDVELKVRNPKIISRKRSGSSGSSGRRRIRRTGTISEIAFQAVTLPYRMATGILYSFASPFQKVLV
ncbi:hypothetical protein JAAARDRAFT_74103 [Jaapia argillacea MUCL 33604]|uniref:Uncharacterized protein n=1 Tax=Jaapia argillacea MUCL 33604 TaxID=933084 RepID=A0A067PJC8_9AGAM|nr:hypothetical protein JAAARDRAFT_74103 [Jaapia argillacea MUCL 33604]